MKKLISIFTVALFLCFSMNSFAQVATGYTFAQSSGTYTPITGGTVLGTATGLSGAASLDDIVYTLANGTIPFNFTFDGVDYTGCFVSTNGYITFANSSTTYSPISNSTTGYRAISAFGGDLNSLYDINGNTGEIRYETVGSEFVIQWSHFRPWSTSASTTIYWNWNFQIRLNSNGQVNVVYDAGFLGAPTSTTKQVGLRGLNNTFATNVNNRLVTAGTHTWAASVAGTSNSSSCAASTTLIPVSGQTYSWTPVGPPPDDMGVTAIVTPVPGSNISDCPAPGLIAPQSTAKNFGSVNQSTFNVYLEITLTGTGIVYSEMMTDNVTLNAGDSRLETFPASFNPNVYGSYTVKSWASIPGDANLLNDTAYSSFTISQPNYGGGALANNGYFFANSTPNAVCAPDQPIYYWEDTTGSTSLIVNGLNVVALGGGSVDDGYFTLTGVLGGKVFNFCGLPYTDFNINTNGTIGIGTSTIGLTGSASYSPVSIPNAGATIAKPAIFPFWKDLNYGDVDVPVNRLSYKVIGNKMIITYDRAPIFGAATGATDYVSFQVVLELADFPGADGMIITNFDEGKSGATFLASYFANTLTAHTVGLQNELGTTGVQYRLRTTQLIVPGPLFSSSVSIAYGPSSGALPVELASFTSTVNNNTVDLNWTTASELNNSGFDIERSVVNGTWSKVGNVAGNGTVTTSNDYSFTDRNLSAGKYNYRLKQIDFNGNFEYFSLNSEVNVGIPTRFELSQNYPNPFNPSTKISYDLPVDGKVSLMLFDMAGREVATLVNEVKTAGYYSVNFNASSLSSGVYFYRISAGNFTATKKMMLVK